MTASNTPAAAPVEPRLDDVERAHDTLGDVEAAHATLADLEAARTDADPEEG